MHIDALISLEIKEPGGVISQSGSKIEKQNNFCPQGLDMKLRIICLTAAATLVGVNVNAATLDFTVPAGGFTVEQYWNAPGADASGALTGAVPNRLLTGEAGFASILIDADGENLDVYIADTASGNPYFDGDSGGKPGGLGSCQTLNASAQCVPSSDDNLTLAADEQLRLDFWADEGGFQQARFGEFTFRDDNHNMINGTVSVHSANGYAIIDVFDGIGDLSSIGKSNHLIFNADGGDGSTSNYYISEANITAVPVPAAVWLFGSGLGLLGWMRKRKVA